MPSQVFHPELRGARFLPRTMLFGPTSLRLTRYLTGLAARRERPDVEVIRIDENVSVRLLRPSLPLEPSPALLWIHGGGLVGGTAAMDDDRCRHFADWAGATVASVEYRLAPEHPFPAPLEDCYTALRWLAAQPGVDADRIALGGESAGGGLAAALALLAADRGELHPVFQLLVYPMLDNRSGFRKDVDPRRLRMWSAANNRFGWRSYLGVAVHGEPPPFAVPARHQDLSGLPPAWIGVGTNDLFHDEDVAYAQRLGGAGVSCELYVVPGAYHGFAAVQPKAPVSRDFLRRQTLALTKALTR